MSLRSACSVGSASGWQQEKISSIFIAKVGLEATGFIGWDYNFADPNGDGRVRATEFDVMAGFSADYATETYVGAGEDVYDQELRVEGTAVAIEGELGSIECQEVRCQGVCGRSR